VRSEVSERIVDFKKVVSSIRRSEWASEIVVDMKHGEQKVLKQVWHIDICWLVLWIH
jgi:hypothetical protein